jgi:hypothetical protein
MYKAIRCTGKVDLSTIQAPSFATNGSWERLAEFESFAKIFWGQVGAGLELDGTKFNKLPLVVKAGPNHSMAFFDSMFSLLAYAKNPKKFNELLRLLKSQGQEDLYDEVM